MATAAAVTHEQRTVSATHLWWGVLTACVLLVYGKIFVELAKDWWRDENYSHGLLLPFALAFLVYQERDRWAQIPSRPAWSGMVLILFSQFVGLVGFLGAEYFLQRVSFAMLACGAVLLLYGWQQLREIALLVLLYLLTVPLPTLIFNQIALPLQLIASITSERILNLLNIPVFREGNILQLPNITLSVAEACSGIRSLMSLITLAVMLAYFLPVRWTWRLLFVASAVPIAIVANSMRVAGTGILARYWGQAAAQGFFHSFSGWLIFVVAFAMLMLEVTVLTKMKGAAAKASA